MLGSKLADLDEGLLHQLNVMLAPIPCDRREQRIHFVEEEDRRRVFPRPGEDLRQSFDRTTYCA